MKSLSFYAPIDKKDSKTHMVYGYASTETLDSQGEIVKKDALASALQDYMQFANIREMHQASAVGKTKHANLDNKGLYIAAKVIDPLAWEKVEEGVYNGFSIGGRVKTMLDNEITGLTLSEISLVDRPANPDCKFDVWKAEGGKPDDVADEEENDEEVETEEKETEEVKLSDTETEKSDAKEKTDDPEITKAAHHAHMVTRMASEMKTLIDAKRASGDDTAHLEGALEALKKAGARELKKPENYATSADGADKPADTNMGTGAYISYADTTEDVQKEEVVVDPKTEFMNTLEKKLREGTMPTEEEIKKSLEYMEMDATDKNISIMKFEFAGQIIKYVEQYMKEPQMVPQKKEAEKVQKEETAPVDEVPHQYDQVRLLIKKLEGQLAKNVDSETGAKYTPNDAPAVPTAPNPSMSTQTSNITQALTMLQEAVKMLSDANVQNALTDTEKEKLTDGVTAGSEKTSKDQYSAEEDMSDQTEERRVNNTRNQSEFGASDKTGDLAKLESLKSEIDVLKADLEKIKSTPVPVKVFASYQTVNKFDESQTDKKAELLKRIDETSDKLKVNPNDPTLQKIAQSLSAEWQKFSRGEYGTS